VIRLASSVAVMVFGTFVATILSALNGYCGDAVAADEESRCHFSVGRQGALFVIAFACLGALAVLGASRMPRVQDWWRWAAAGAVTAVCLVVPWVLLLAAIHDRLDYWHSGGGGARAPESNGLAAAVIVLLTPPTA
jgi:hypothetical protein